MTAPAPGAENELELRALATMVRLASRFTLGFVVANQPSLLEAARRALAEVLGEEGVARLEVGADPGADLLGAIARAARPSRVAAVVVEGIERLLDPKGESPSPAIARLNLRRTELSEACPKPLVFLLAQWALRELTRSAPDLWAWRSGLYRLRGDAREVEQALEGLVTDPSSEQRSRRMSRRVLRHLLDEILEDDAALRFRVLLDLAGVEVGFGSYEDADGHYRQAHEIATELGDRLGESYSLRGLADT
ncbi:MAG: hypothetical protein ACRDJF_08390, partial [Actinomycetota bacterium]